MYDDVDDNNICNAASTRITIITSAMPTCEDVADMAMRAHARESAAAVAALVARRQSHALPPLHLGKHEGTDDANTVVGRASALGSSASSSAASSAAGSALSSPRMTGSAADSPRAGSDAPPPRVAPPRVAPARVAGSALPRQPTLASIASLGHRLQQLSQFCIAPDTIAMVLERCGYVVEVD